MLNEIISTYIAHNFPKIEKHDWDIAQQQLTEAMKLTISFSILDQLNDTNGEEARIEVRDNLEYNPEYYECTQLVCEQFKKAGFDVKEEFDYDHPVFIITKI